MATRAPKVVGRVVEVLAAVDDPSPLAFVPGQRASFTSKLYNELQARKKLGHEAVDLAELVAVAQYIDCYSFSHWVLMRTVQPPSKAGIPVPSESRHLATLLIDQLTDQLIDQLTDQLINQLTDQLTDQLTQAI
jgi:hypothetical protein